MKNLLKLFITCNLWFCCVLLFAQTITVNGTPSFTISGSDVLAGENLDTVLESSNSITIDITHSHVHWHTQVNKSDINWNSSVKIWVIRTGDGSGIGGGSKISGGTTYQEVTNTATNFFVGQKSRTDIPIRYKITGMNVSLNAIDISTTIIHTVYDKK